MVLNASLTTRWQFLYFERIRCVSVTYCHTQIGQWHLWLSSVHQAVLPWRPWHAGGHEPWSHLHTGLWSVDTYIFKSILMSQQCLFVTFPHKSMHVRASFIHLPSVSGGRAPLISVQQRFCLIFVKLDQIWWIKYAGFPSDVLWLLYLVNSSFTCCCSVC